MDEDGSRMLYLARSGDDPIAHSICVGVGVIQPEQPPSSDCGGALYRVPRKEGTESQHAQAE